MPPTLRHILHRSLILAAVVALAGCSIAPPRTDDPWESFNRKAYAFNHTIDRIAIRPTAMAYREVTTPPVREHINYFFSNIQLPVTVVNDLLQARPKRALSASGRFLINLTLGVLGFFDPATSLGIPEHDTDFGVTLARWGAPEGPYLVMPLLGPTTMRDIWRIPAGYYLNPMSIYAHNHDYTYGQQYLPELIYLISLRSRAINAESFLKSAYDPYVFLRDAYRQRRLYKIYYGHPPIDIIRHLQGLDQPDFNPEELLEQQRAWEHKHDDQDGDLQPAAASSI